MSEMTSAEQHQQQFVGGSSNSEHHCKDHSVFFESEKSLELHVRYHNEDLPSQWTSQAQQEESNDNNSKTGNHSSSNHMVVNRESVIVSTDSSEPFWRPPSEGTAFSSRQQPTPTSQGFQDFPTPMFAENIYYMRNEQNYVLPHSNSPNREDSQNGGGNYSRYHPYQHQQRFPQWDQANSVRSSSPRSPLQCDKCGAFYEDPHQLAEHVRSSHHTSPNTYPGQPQYQQIGTSPQHQIQRQQQSQIHTSPPHTNQQQPGFDFSGRTIIKTELKQKAEDQAEILDLDSHKVQTHRYEEDLIRAHHQQQEIQMQHHAMQHQQRSAPHSVSSMLSWPSPQLHEYHSRISPIGPMDSTSSMPDQAQFIRPSQLPLESPSEHGGSPIITSTQSLETHQLAPALLQQSKKALVNQSCKSKEPRRSKSYNCSTCNKWFASSGHLSRHYNTTVHKNAVKKSKPPDPANMSISVHHHPGRDALNTRRPKSPELSSTGSPPNLMAGPSGEATRGLLHTPATNNVDSNSNSNESSGIQGTLSQQQVASAARMSNLEPLNCPPHSPMGHHPQQMGAPSPPLDQHNLQMNSTQMGVYHHMNPPITSIQHPLTYLNSPFPMGQHHHMDSPSPMMGGVPSMATPSTPMGGTMMPHQPYPNDLPPHVTTTTSIQGLMDITRLITTGNDLQSNMQFTQEMLPSFGAFNKTQRPLLSFTNFGMSLGYNLVGHNQLQAVNVGGLSPEENIPPPDRSFNVLMPTYDTYRHSPPKYESLTNMDGLHYTAPNGNMYFKYQDYLQQESTLFYDIPRSRFQIEPNNNVPEEPPKEELNPNIKRRKNAKLKGVITKEQQVTSTNPELPYIYEDGPHKCRYCNKYFNKSGYLTQHYKSSHAGDKPFRCNRCGKRFPHENMHAAHLQKHAGEKPYKCDICPKQFNHKIDLRRHMCLHTGEKPYACDICQRGFVRKDHMMKHVETHKTKQSTATVQLNVHHRA